jgi:hypothetical protein
MTIFQMGNILDNILQHNKWRESRLSTQSFYLSALLKPGIDLMRWIGWSQNYHRWKRKVPRLATHGSSVGTLENMS